MLTTRSADSADLTDGSDNMIVIYTYDADGRLRARRPTAMERTRPTNTTPTVTFSI